MNKLWALIGAVLIILAGVWHLWIGERWTRRIPSGWQWTASFIGVIGYADPQTGKFPEKDSSATYERSIKIASSSPTSVTLVDAYTVRNFVSGKVEWDYISQVDVDPQTGAHLDQQEQRGDYYIFPRQVEKKTYRISMNYLKRIPLSFEREEEIEGLLTYRFGYRGRAEYTESYAGTPEYPGTKVGPGQEIRCLDDQFTIVMWVEPTSGELVKLEEGCYSGDYIYDVATNQPVAAVMRWGGVTEGNDVVSRAERIRQERRAYLAARCFPLVLLLSGLLTLGGGLVRRHRL
jgi:hypothetical protein